MKKLLLILAMYFAHQIVFAQGVGINTNVPDPSAALDIKSPGGSNKGILIPQVNLTSLTDATTILAPSKSLLIWNTNASIGTGTGFYYNDNNYINPKWLNLSKQFALPYDYAGNSNTALFQLQNYNSSNTAISILGDYAGNMPGGTGVLAKSNFGKALHVDGRMQIDGAGQSPGAGKVLTSDANGNATWQAQEKVAFRAFGVKGGGSEKIANVVETRITFATEDYDLSNNYNDANGSPHSTFIAPVAGIYHFDGQVSWDYSVDAQFINSTSLALRMMRNGVDTNLGISFSFSSDSHSITLSTDCLLQQGDKIFIIATQNSGDYRSLREFVSQSTFFSGRLVMKQ